MALMYMERKKDYMNMKEAINFSSYIKLDQSYEVKICVYNKLKHK